MDITESSRTTARWSETRPAHSEGKRAQRVNAVWPSAGGGRRCRSKDVIKQPEAVEMLIWAASRATGSSRVACGKTTKSESFIRGVIECKCTRLAGTDEPEAVCRVV